MVWAGRDLKDHPVMMDSAFGRVNKNKDPLGEKNPHHGVIYIC